MVILPYILFKSYDIFILCPEIPEETFFFERHAMVCGKEGNREAAGSMDYSSSDESDWPEDENGELRHSGFLVEKLPGERTCLKNAKQSLDEAYMHGLNQQARQNLAIRRIHHLPST